MQRVRRILEKIGCILKFFVWTVPKSLLWTIPKHVVTTVPKAVFVTLPKEVWERRHKVGPWCKRQIYKFPIRVKKVADYAKIATGLGNIGTAAFDILERLASLAHTIIEAVMSFFRAVTLRDVVNGFCAVLRAVFVDFPKAAAWFMTTVGKTAYEVFGYILGTLGKVIFYAVDLTIRLLGWLPRKTWEMLLGCGKSVGKGVEEVLVWINPKRI
ncbi:hypothetical protein CCMA1212_005503 [Trichoderma ghanense]|uniref:Uncharacterized protein n=1 Tax=Trichoderma ghanense TaxID=65468 RepID=A0ABY2H3Z0_9HYPO